MMPVQTGLTIEGKRHVLECLTSDQSYFLAKDEGGAPVLVYRPSGRIDGETWIAEAPRGRGDIFHRDYCLPEPHDLKAFDIKWRSAADGQPPRDFDRDGFPVV